MHRLIIYGPCLHRGHVLLRLKLQTLASAFLISNSNSNNSSVTSSKLVNLSDLHFLIIYSEDNNGKYLLELMRLNGVILVNLLASGLADGKHGINVSFYHWLSKLYIIVERSCFKL